MKNDIRPKKEGIVSDDSVDEMCRADFYSDGLFPRTGRSGLPLCACLRPGFKASAVASKIAQIRSYSLLTVCAFQVWTAGRRAPTRPPLHNLAASRTLKVVLKIYPHMAVERCIVVLAETFVSTVALMGLCIVVSVMATTSPTSAPPTAQTMVSTIAPTMAPHAQKEPMPRMRPPCRPLLKNHIVIRVDS